MMPALPRLGHAQAANTIRIGVLNDQSGTYRDISGPYGVECTKQAVAEFGNKGFNVEVIFADHQNKPDVGVNIARQWYDQGVDLILDVPTSSVGARGQQRRAREEQGLHQHRFGHLRPDRRAVQPEYRALDVRHLHAGQVDRRRDGEGRRGQLVLHHRRLRLRPCAANATPAIRQGGGRQGDGPVRYPFPATPISAPSCFRRRPPAPRSSAWPMPAPIPSTASSRRPNSAS